MMLSLLKFEWQLHSRQPVFMLGLLVCVFFGGFLIQNQSVDSDVLVAGPYNMANSICILALMIVPFLVGAFTGNAIVRDRNARITELIFSTPITKMHYLLSRWLGLVAISSLVFTSAIIGILVSLLFSDTGEIGFAHTLWSLLWPLIILILPGIALLSSILFAVGLFSNQNIAVYIVAVIIFLLYQLLAVYSGSPLMANPIAPDETLKQILSGIDPYGATSFFEQVKYWSPTQRNSQFFELKGMLLYNRVGVLLLSVVILALCYRKFDFKLAKHKTASKSKAGIIEKSTVAEIQYRYQPVQPNTGIKASWLAFTEQCKLEYLSTLKTRVFFAVLVFWTVVLVTEIIAGLSSLENLGTTPIASTAEALWRFQYDVLPRFITLFLVYFVAEMAWRDEENNVASFIYSSPVANISLFFAKLIALLLIPVTFITIAIGISSGLQVIYGGQVEWSLYLSLYYYSGLPMVCIAALCLFIHSVSPNKFVGMSISFSLVILAITSLGGQLGLEHGLFKFSTSPLMQYSDLIGFNSTSDAFNGYIKYWLSLSAVMVLLGYGFYRRGVGVPLRLRIQYIGKQGVGKQGVGKQWGYQGLALMVVSVLASGYFGSAVFYQTNEVAHYQSSQERVNWRAEYERKYDQYEHMLSPKVVNIKTHMALYPEQHRYQMKADFTLVNSHFESLNQILVSTDADVHYQNVAISGATLSHYDADFGQYLFKLNAPMLPGDRLQMTFTASQVQNGYLGLQRDNLITPGFSYVQALRYMPFFGFNHHYQLKSPSLRRDQGLPELAPALSLEQAVDEVKGDFSADYDWLEFETVLSTSADEVAIAPGKLIKKWKNNDRNYYHYKTAGPIRNVISYISGRYKMASRFVDGIELQVYYHAEHQDNVEHTLDAMSASINYANKHFGRYLGEQLRLMEVPRNLGLSGYAMPETILISELEGFRTDLSNKEAFDQVFRRTAHEVAHQWWGHGLDSAAVEGGTVLVETLAKYTELVLLEQRYGNEYVRRLMKYEHRRYFNGRGYSSEHELPLYRADARYLVYSKGAVAMYALKNILGEEAINQALRQLMQNHKYPKIPATTLDLIAALKQTTTANNYPVIDRWLKQIIIDDLSITSASYQQLGNSHYKVNVCLQSQQTKEDGLGNSFAISTETTAWLGVFSEHPDNLISRGSDSAVLKIAKVAVKSEGNCLSWTVAGKPTHIAIDPFYQKLDQQRDNNVSVPVFASK